MLKRKNTKKNIILSIILIAFIGALALFVLEKLHITDFIKSPLSNSTDQTTSQAPSAQSNFTGGNDRQPIQTTTNEGTMSDNNGAVSSVPPESQWLTSESGVISVFSPLKDSLVQNGQQLSGKSTASTVSFRLADNVSGVIASGSINVVDGKFAGTFNFSTTASTGRIDLFTMTPDGVESNHVRIPIRFR